MKNTENLVVVHLSATAVYVVIGNVVSAKDIRILGVGQVKNSDFYQGQIKHRERLQGAIKQAIQEAEDIANCRVHSVWLTLATPELSSKNSAGEVRVEDDVVRAKDMVQALSNAKSRDLSSDYYLMHCCQQGIYVDEQDFMVDDAIETMAHNITVMYHMMMLPVASRQNIQKLLQSCDVGIDHIVFDAVTSAEYSLMSDERQQGVCLVDIGASTTSICVYKENKLIFTHCIATGSHEVTMDISADFGISMIEAEKLKKTHGTVDVNSVDPSSFFIFKPQGSGDEINVGIYNLARIIEARYIQIFTEVARQLHEADLISYIDKGIVLTGGGSVIKGMIPFTKKLLKMPVVLTNTHPAISAYNHFDNDESFKQLNIQVNDRAYQTAFGTLLYSQSEQFRRSEKSEPEAIQKNRVTGVFQSAGQRFASVLKKIL
ncbi:cell division protein FtsA [Psychrobacter sp. AOP22-C1-22]|uniref:cell division protein FtsA n=1 Tax=unclassified Psychrobacter TaxID=196806 RepID=UPI0017887CE2|nr:MULTISPECIES: cell division protein FtsA [unclassified Psychrobacter]MDN5802167.1 cell division protein FtsA [Psychrobacter sp.]MBE0406013.1 cell division protein FtsA [Psychrobacter sp. FME6]MBE0444335.1 cell division protein FtsA [Psychrobacter sp. FME5]MDN5891895.1 cell division protein FtsA [Psychrobacter sp.]MDN5898046.1 cell division protein FtsA [Psychrobacter sp.]